MSAGGLAPSSPWSHPGGLCPECAFDWDEERYEVLVGQCVSTIAVFGRVLSRIDPAEAVEPGLWSASRYVWHTVDVLRFGAERLWTISADPTFGVPAWDENVVADVRSYDQLSPVVGLVALLAAADTWRTAALEAPHDVTTPHPEAGSICAFDVVQRNAHEVCHHLWDVEPRHALMSRRAATWCSVPNPESLQTTPLIQGGAGPRRGSHLLKFFPAPAEATTHEQFV